MNQPRIDLRCLVDTAVKQWSEFDTDEPVNGAQLVEWFSTWRTLAKIALKQPEEANGSPLAEAAPDLLRGCMAALAYLADPPSTFPINRNEATEIIRDAVTRATKGKP